jgi:hypothetical protein
MSPSTHNWLLVVVVVVVVYNAAAGGHNSCLPSSWLDSLIYGLIIRKEDLSCTAEEMSARAGHGRRVYGTFARLPENRCAFLSFFFFLSFFLFSFRLVLLFSKAQTRGGCVRDDLYRIFSRRHHFYTYIQL